MIETVKSHDIMPITEVPEQQKNTDASIIIHGSGINIELPVDISSEILSAAIRGLRTR